jgi:hypothetical protein
MLSDILQRALGKTRPAVLLSALLLILALVHFTTVHASRLDGSDSDAVASEDPVSLTGRLIDPQGEPIGQAEVHLVVDGKLVPPETASSCWRWPGNGPKGKA